MHIEVIDHRSPHFPTVKVLGKANAQTLGFFPEGAFDQYARRRTILVALDATKQCLGYLLYRETGGYACIVHLCIASVARGKGVARQLFEYLCEITRHLRGIRADCRRDYAENKMWQRLGFRAMSERPGRAKHGSKLTVWWLDHGLPDLFTAMTAEQLASKLLVAIDTNVFYDLIDPSRPEREEAQSLLHDWLQADIELAVSAELWNEINRSIDEQQRRRARDKATQLTHFPTARNAFESAQQKLRPLFPTNLSVHDESDLRQLAYTVAAEVPFFVTRDAAILERADTVYDLTGLSIFRPSDLIVRLDALRREAAYQPARLAGTLMELRRIQIREQDTITHAFLHDTQGEGLADFEHRLRRYLTTPVTYECLIALDDTQTPLALIVYDQTQVGELHVPLFRVRRGTLAATLVRYGILTAMIRSAQGNREVTRFTDSYLDETTVTALQDDGFTSVGNEWWKLSFAVAEVAASIAAQLGILAPRQPAIATYAQQLAAMLTAPAATQNASVMAALEHILWPAKVIDADIPSFLVPIRPSWAKELFDVHLANQTLFGTTKRLALNREAIYYRAHRPEVLAAPGRILWYVSQDKRQRYQGGSAIRACSRLEEVVIGLPKDLFRRFRRLGIYEWPDVLAAAHGNVNQPIMALRFSNTELFKYPVTLDDLRRVYKTHGHGLMVQSASRLPTSALFARLYQRGIHGISGEETPITS